MAGSLDATGSLDVGGGSLTQNEGDTRYPQLGAANTFTTGPQTLTTGAAGNKGSIIKGAASQTANLTEWQDSTGTALAAISSAGVVLAAPGAAATPGLSFLGDTDSGFWRSANNVIRTSLGGTDYLLFTADEVRSKSSLAIGWTAGAVTGALDTSLIRAAAGQIQADLFKWKAANEQTTVGAAGGASALPATPTKFLKIVDSAGTTLVVPAYAAS